MRRVINSSVRGVAVVAVMCVLAGSAFAAPRETREQGFAKIGKKIVRALGDGLTVPLPKATPSPNP